MWFQRYFLTVYYSFDLSLSHWTFFLAETQSFRRGEISHESHLTRTEMEEYIYLVWKSELNFLLLDICIGWQNGKELDFYPSSLGSSPVQVSTTKRRSSKTAQCAFHDLESQGVLKNIKKKIPWSFRSQLLCLALDRQFSCSASLQLWEPICRIPCHL